MAYYRCMGGNSLTPYTINVTCDPDFAGHTITMSQEGQKTLIKVCPSTEPYVVTFNPAYSGIWKINGVIESSEYESDIELTFFGIYEAELNARSYKKWLELGRVTKSFSSLDDVLADQTTLRQLMYIHASADYMLEWLQNDSNFRSKLLANDNALKWIGLSDYAYDKLPSDFLAEWLAGPRWERALKDHVPAMTSNTAPYGTVSFSSEMSGGEAYRVFRIISDTNGGWNSQAGIPQWLCYKFTNPINVKKLLLKTGSKGGPIAKLQGSNDGTQWEDLTSSYDFKEANKEYVLDVNTDKYFMYYREYCTDSNYVYSSQKYVLIDRLQFYGRSLNVSVPTMTSNTAPYGEAIGSQQEGNDTALYKVFDKKTDTFGVTYGISKSASSNNPKYIGYNFGKSINIRAVMINNTQGSNTYQGNANIELSNDGVNWENVKTIQFPSYQNDIRSIELNEDESYKYCRIYTTNGNRKSGENYLFLSFTELNFYGVDYSEREFEQGSTVKYLYDHGVELMTSVKSSSGVTVGDDFVEIKPIASETNYVYGARINTYNYKLLRVRIGDVYTPTHVECGIFNNPSIYWGESPIAQIRAQINTNYPNFGLNIENINGEYYCLLFTNNATGANRQARLEELWLE